MIEVIALARTVGPDAYRYAGTVHHKPRDLRLGSLGLVAVLACAGLSAPAAPQEYSTLAISANASTLGFGGDLVLGASRYFAFRAGGHAARLGPRFNQADITYDVIFDWRSLQAVLDFHPWGNALRISTGGLLNGNRMRLLLRPTHPFSMGDSVYLPATIGSLEGSVHFNRIAPYLGLGLGSRTRPGLTLDVGLVYQGSPRQSYSGITRLTGFARDYFDQRVAIETVRIHEEVRSTKFLRFYPVVSLGWSARIW